MESKKEQNISAGAGIAIAGIWTGCSAATITWIVAFTKLWDGWEASYSHNHWVAALVLGVIVLPIAIAMFATEMILERR